MPKFAANLTMMFSEVPFLDRFTAAAGAGFPAVEFLFPYDFPPEEVAGTADSAGVEVVLFNMPPGDWTAGERGIACIPGSGEEFRKGVAKAITYARALKTPRLHAMAGIVPPGVDPAICRRTLVENLSWAAARLAEERLTLVLEAINTRDIPGFSVSTQSDLYSVLEAVGAPNLKMQMDIYHMQVMEGDLATRLRHYLPHCGHIQIAGCPDRHEPDTGEIRYDYLFQLLDEIGYDGWVGCEYRPAGETSAGLGWFKALNAGRPLVEQ